MARAHLEWRVADRARGVEVWSGVSAGLVPPPETDLDDVPAGLAVRCTARGPVRRWAPTLCFVLGTTAHTVLLDTSPRHDLPEAFVIGRT